jgi:translation initiation factor IF-1
LRLSLEITIYGPLGRTGPPEGPYVARRRRNFDDVQANDDRDDHVKLDGVITNVFAGGQFEVKTDAGAIVRAQLCGRMRKYRISVILGDRVTVALSPYDLTHGMIVYRAK